MTRVLLAVPTLSVVAYIYVCMYTSLYKYIHMYINSIYIDISI